MGINWLVNSIVKVKYYGNNYDKYMYKYCETDFKYIIFMV